MVFCNAFISGDVILDKKVTILILIDGFLQFGIETPLGISHKKVTILILIDGFLQYGYILNTMFRKIRSQSLF